MSPRAIVAWILLATLHATAIYAPLIANDRPLFLEAIDRAAVRAALYGLVPSAEAWQRLRALSDADYERGRVGGSSMSRARAMQLELDALERKVATLSTYVARADTGPLRAVTDELERARLPVAPTGTELRAACGNAREALASAALIPIRSFPLLASLTWLDVCLMLVWPVVAAWPFLRAPWRTRIAGIAVVVASFAAFAVPVRSTSSAEFKRRLASGELDAQRVLFPPIPMGFAETNLTEILRPPTWTRASHADEAGVYTRRARSEPVDGFAASATPIDVRFGERARNAPLRHVLGTDSVGRDVLARTLWGGRISLIVGLSSALALTAIGTVLGALAGYFAGRTDFAISRALEVVIAFPAFFLILLVLSLSDPDALPPVLAIALVIAAVGWTGVARLVRAELLRLREREFVLAARSLGFSHARIVLRHLLPNALGPIVVAFVFAVAGGILVESALGFLGFGARHPYPSWGALINESRAPEHWWIQVFPGLFIFTTVIAYNLAGESLQNALARRDSRASTAEARA